jgi:response regulator RpfG family c-di-GMP phosphodiesterase
MNLSTSQAPILVVDDEEVIAMALEEILRQAGYEVLTYSDPALALEALKQRPVSVVISDQKMPGLSGLELLNEAKRLRPNATRILITGVLDLGTMIGAINQGEIFRFIVKPWLREEFLATVANALQRYDLLRQNENLKSATETANEQLATTRRALEEQSRAIADQSKRLEELNATVDETFAGFATLSLQTLEAFHPALGAQARCVATICESVAEVLSLNREERRVLNCAARLYDLGMVTLPRSLIQRWLDTPEELNPEERERIRQHPIVGQDLVGSGAHFESVGKIIRTHHERFDGKGYPDGLSGGQSSWLARLLAVAVGYAEKQVSPVTGLQQVQKEAGTRYDPQAVRVLAQAIAQAGLPSKEREIPLKDLAPGMVLSRAIYSHNGVLLIPAGQRLNAAYIDQLARHHRDHPLPQSLLVYC